MIWNYGFYHLLPSFLLWVERVPAVKDWGAGGAWGPDKPFGPIEGHLYSVSLILYPVVMFCLIMLGLLMIYQLIRKLFGLPTIWDKKKEKV